jgi:hypothetical protein
MLFERKWTIAMLHMRSLKMGDDVRLRTCRYSVLMPSECVLGLLLLPSMGDRLTVRSPSLRGRLNGR